jgi:type I restriction enzyme S subunit
MQGNKIGSSKQMVEPNDVLLCKINPRINRVWVVGEKRDYRQIASTEWIVLRGDSNTNPNYIGFVLQSSYFRDIFAGNVSGVGGSLTRARPKDAAMYPVPIAPLSEQNRIAEKLESLLGKIKQAKVLLDEIPEILRNFRQSVLATATTGKLTEAWREQNGQPEDWQRKRIEHLTTKVGSGSTPRGGEAAYKTEGVPFIRSMNIIFFGFKRERMPFLSSEQAHDLRNVEVRARDVLLNITGASIGRVTTVPPDLDGARVNQHVCIIRPKAELLPEFLCWFLSAPDMQQVIGVENYGVTRQALTKQQILDFEVPVPPLSEQREIVRRVESLFSKADELEAQYKDAMDLIESLPEIILSKAFRGELVPQDPNDEPASVLLKRIIQSLDREKPIEIQRKSFGLGARNMMNYKDMIA